MELKDKVIGTTDEQGVTLPPLHPRCRCVIEYREIIGGNMRPEPNKEPPPRAEADSDLQRFSTYEENKERFSHHDLPHGIIRVTRTLLHAAPYAVTEIVNKKGGITRVCWQNRTNKKT